ncbi:MAG: 50S ribosomal protein L15 [Phycisphaerales bacterium]|nr:50S ribosomal protein L15 [Phycisphaerales bacterium]
MMIHDITALAGASKNRKRVGRGKYGARGKTSGRGQKGAGSRHGHSTLYQFEGGQMPYFRRMPKFGFTNAVHTVNFWVVNLRDLLAHPNFAKGGEVSPATLIKAGLVRDESRDVKILGTLPEGKDKIGVALTVNVSRCSVSARRHIEAAGGKVTESGTRRDRVRGVDRNSDDKTPKNLTKKLKRGGKKAVVSDDASE